MSNPESIRKAELTANDSAAADWGAASGRSRGSETKIAMLLVVVLLGALSFVVYRKLNSQTPTLANSTDFQPVGEDDASPSLAAASESGDQTWSSLDETDAAQDPWSVAGGSPQSEPPQQPEPAYVDWGSAPADEPVSQSRPAPSYAQLEPEGPESTSGPPSHWAPFPGESGAEPAPGTERSWRRPWQRGRVRSGHRGSGCRHGRMHPNRSTTANGYRILRQERVIVASSSTTAAGSAASGPVMELFDGDPEMGQSERAATRTAAAADPWGGIEDESDYSNPPAQDVRTASAEPLLIEPRDPHVVPVAAADPFGAEPLEEEPTAEPHSLGASDSWDLAAEPEPRPARTANDFAAAAPTLTFEPDTPASEPVDDIWGGGPVSPAAMKRRSGLLAAGRRSFDPAAGVSHAAREEAVTIHVVQSETASGRLRRSTMERAILQPLAAFNRTRI